MTSSNWNVSNEVFTFLYYIPSLTQKSVLKETHHQIQSIQAIRRGLNCIILFENDDDPLLSTGDSSHKGHMHGKANPIIPNLTP